MSDIPSIRINKVVKEFNVGISTLIDFLKKKGIEVDASPNSKITNEAYLLVQKEFGKEVLLKEQSKKIILKVKDITGNLESKEPAPKQGYDSKSEPQPEPVIEPQAKPVVEPQAKPIVEPQAKPIVETQAKPVVEPQAKPVVEPQAKPVVEPQAKPVVEPQAKPVVEPQTQPVVEPQTQPILEPKVVTQVQPETQPAPKAEAATPAENIAKTENKEEAATKEIDSNPKEQKVSASESPVLGHINLETLNQRSKKQQGGKKDRRQQAPQARPQTPATTSTPSSATTSTPSPAPISIKDVVKADELDTPAEKPVIEHIETTYEKISGPTIRGEIDLSQFEKKRHEKPASAPEKQKGKRERIQKDGKVDVAKIAARKDNAPSDKKKKKDRFKPIHTEVDDDAIQKQIKETYARMTEGKGKTKGSKHRREKREGFRQSEMEEMERREQESTILKVTEFVTVNELATLINVSVNKVIESCMNLGQMVSINQRLDAEAMVLIAEEFGYQVEFVTAEIHDAIAQKEDNQEDLVERPPIITVMGHVDHGKTSLLDYIRQANVIAGEAGGITQHIGAYSVKLDSGRTITFLDTPGHEAFTAMRARGAKITDLAIIIIAADDAIMPQTIEAINHAMAAGVPMVFAINKIDKPGANPERIREQLANMNILVEDWGGKYQCQEISAKKGTNVDKLLEKVLLEADMLELKANPNKKAVGSVIESSLDKGRGYLATIMVQAGTLHTGDIMLSGSYSGRVKAMFNERGQKLEKAGPSTPVSVLGLNGAPTAGEVFNVMDSEKEAREVAAKREQLMRIQELLTKPHITLEEIGRRIAIGNFRKLDLIVKGDVDGSVEALSDSLIKLSTEEIQVDVIHKAVGAISESDVNLATSSNAIIIGFQVRPSADARRLAEKEKIEIRLYSIIYDAINEVKSGIEGMLAPEEKEDITATVEVRETFKISKVGTIAGCMVKEGKIVRNAKVRIIRDGIVIHTGVLGSLKRFKDDVKEVSSGYDCGLNIESFNDIKVGDIIEAYTIVEIKRKL